MLKPGIRRLPARMVDLIWFHGRAVLKRIRPDNNALVLVFGGRTKFWPGMGKDLFAHNARFRETIYACDSIIRARFGDSILPYFEDGEVQHTAEKEATKVFIITSVQLALCELWKEKGIEPYCVLGISLGEFASLYACGALNLEEALTLCQCVAEVTETERCEYITLVIFAGFENLKPLCTLCPVPVYTIFSIDPGSVLGYCRSADLLQVVDYFGKHGIVARQTFSDLYWPFHTCLVDNCKQQILALTKDFKPRPLTCDYYSPTLGKLINKNSVLPSGYWFDIFRKPVRVYEVLKLLKTRQKLALLHLGPQFFLRTQFEKCLPKEVPMFESLTSGQNNPEVVDRIFRHLNRLKAGLLKNRPRVSDKARLEEFLAQLDLQSDAFQADPLPAFSYLRQHGPVHFLPKRNCWLVLNEEEISHALKQPQVFSSKVHQDFDAVLLGADPPAHTHVRSLLQPFFSPQAFSLLGEYARQVALNLAEGFSAEKEIEVVQSFSLPLSQQVIAHFLGLDSQETDSINTLLKAKGHTYSLSYLPELLEFFREYLTKRQLAEAKADIGTHLLGFVASGQLHFEEAASLMRMLWIAGMTTTSMLLSHAVFYLLQPEIRNKLEENPGLIPNFIEECLRLEPPESELLRITTCATELGATRIPEGSLVCLSIRAANRQADQFPEPDTFSLSRPAKRHLSFGGGYHYCLGIGLARTEVRSAVQVLLEKLPAMHLSPRPDAFSFFRSAHFRALESLYVCLPENQPCNPL